MFSNEDLDSAVAAGAISQEAAEALRRHVAEKAASPAVDEENFRLVSGFNDIFVVIAGSLLLISVAWIGNNIARWLGPLAVACTSWALAEFFVRIRRMALPAIVFLLSFVGGVFYAFSPLFLITGGTSLAGSSGTAIASLITVVLCVAHWKRFRVPITIAAGTVVVLGGSVISLLLAFPAVRDWLSPMLFVAGSLAFAFALWWDMSDPTRVTRRSDVAFWLHLAAAPMLVHPLFANAGTSSVEAGIAQTLFVLLMYFLIALVSLAIDRRALMVSALGYVLFAFSSLLKQAGIVSLGFAITALVLGSALLFLSAFWHGSRTQVVSCLPPSIRRYLAPLK
jgi:hypothetical protein